jgi:hypothetical protein
MLLHCARLYSAAPVLLSARELHHFNQLVSPQRCLCVSLRATCIVLDLQLSTVLLT